jgi:hypothetical protein
MTRSLPGDKGVKHAAWLLFGKMDGEASHLERWKIDS